MKQWFNIQLTADFATFPFQHLFDLGIELTENPLSKCASVHRTPMTRHNTQLEGTTWKNKTLGKEGEGQTQRTGKHRTPNLLDQNQMHKGLMQVGTARESGAITAREGPSRQS